VILNALVEKLKRRSKHDFQGRHFEASLTQECLRAVAILHTRRVDVNGEQQAERVGQDVACGRPPSCRHRSRTDQAKPPFEGALGGLAVDDRRRRARLATHLLSDLNIERVVDAPQRPVPVPEMRKLEMI
jgi:hypothetical protein